MPQLVFKRDDLRSLLSINASTPFRYFSLARYDPDDSSSINFTDILFSTAANNSVTGQALTGRLNTCVSALSSSPFSSITVGIPNGLPSSTFVPCFEAATFKTEQGSVNLTLRLIYTFTEKLTLDVLVGGTETGSKRDSFSAAKQGKFLNRDKTHSSAYEASLSYRGERLSSSLHGSRKNETTTSGSLQIADRIEWKSSWKAYTHDTLELDLIWFQRKEDAQNNVNFNTSSVNNQHYIARIQYSHRLSQDWSTRFRYQYRSKVFDDSSDDAERSDVMMSLSWSPTRWQWSR